MPVMIAHPVKQLEIISPTKLSAGKGRVAWNCGFESNVNPFDGGSIDNTAVRVRNGIYALKITSAGTDPWTTSANTKVMGVRPEMTDSLVAVEFWVQFEAITTAAGGLTSLSINFDIQDGTNLWSPYFKMAFGATAADVALQYYTTGGSFTSFATGVTFNTNTYYRFKLIIDMVTGYYHSLVFANKTYDLSAYAIKSASNADRRSQLKFELIGVDATTKSVWIDDVTMTTDE